MINTEIEPISNIAYLGSFLQGLSYLCVDSRANFASAFKVDAVNIPDFFLEVKSIFEHLPDLELDIDERYQGGLAQLEQDIASHLLVDPHIENDEEAQNICRYLSYKVIDRIDLTIGKLENFDPPKRIFGKSKQVPGSMVFFLLISRNISFALQFSQR